MSDWRPTPELRFAVPDRTTDERPVLQQLWISDRIGPFGYVAGFDEEWRDVRRAVIDAAGKEVPIR